MKKIQIAQIVCAILGMMLCLVSLAIVIINWITPLNIWTFIWTSVAILVFGCIELALSSISFSKYNDDVDFYEFELDRVLLYFSDIYIIIGTLMTILNLTKFIF